MAVILALAVKPASATTPTLFHCKFTEVVKVQEGPSIGEEAQSHLHNPVTVDVVSGLVRWGPEQMVSRWQVVQQGDNISDWVLKRALDDEQTERRDDGVVRIRNWAEGWRGVPAIIHYDFGSLYVGTCEKP